MFLEGLASRFDLPEKMLQTKQVEELEMRLEFLLNVYEKMKKELTRPRLARFYGFKSNMGVDSYPQPELGFNNLFEPSHMPYQSDRMDGPVIVQGVYIPEDPGQMYREDQRIKDLIDGKLRVIKSEDRNEEPYTQSVDE